MLGATVLTVMLNGKPLRSYIPVYVREGRIIAPLDPYVTSVVASIEQSGRVLLVRRADRFAQVSMPALPHPAAFPATLVELGPLLRTIGIRISYDKPRHTVYIETPPTPLTTPTPFNAAVPSAPPRVVFTPSPQPTTRPVVTGTPLPRRTPLPLDTSVPQSQPNRSRK